MVQIHLGAPLKQVSGRIAQGLERLLDTQEVRGSIPRAPTIKIPSINCNQVNFKWFCFDANQNNPVPARGAWYTGESLSAHQS